MRHGMRNRKLGRTTAHRLALFRNQLASLVESEHIVTTLPKAKELRPIAERVITQGKRGTVHARRLAGRWLLDRELIKKLFDELAPRFDARAGGYLRIVKLGPRPGDGAEMAVLEFVDFVPKPKAEKKETPGAKGKAEGKEGKAEGAEKGEKQENLAAAPERKRRFGRPRPATEAPAEAKGKHDRGKGAKVHTKPAAMSKPKGPTKRGES